MAFRTDVDTSKMSRTQLEARVVQLEAHVTQLRNLLAKAEGETNKRKKKHKERPFDFNKYNTRHVALKIAYFGWDYSAFAVLEHTQKTIEAQLFLALTRTKLIEKRESSNYHRCGRTDKGVSAFSQVVSLDLRTNLLSGQGVKLREGGLADERLGDKTTEIDYVHLLNKILPPEIRVLAWSPVNVDFSARFSCTQRTYKYYFPRGQLNIKAMEEAARKLHGPHDFRNLCKMDINNGVTTFTRNIFHTSIEPLNDGEDGAYKMMELTVVGKAFLWHQIRCIVAVLILVGQGKEKPEVIDALLDVEAQPCKPNYTLALEIPLILFGSEFEDVQWIYDKDVYTDTVGRLQELWTHQAIKATMIKRCLEELEHVRPDVDMSTAAACNQVECLLPGHRPRVYKALLDRQTGESLEQRIQHFDSKRRKVEDSTEDHSVDEDSAEDHMSEDSDVNVDQKDGSSSR